MNRFQITLENLIELHRFASIGRLVNGLIHNLNGPLHSLGIEMDVMNHLVLKRAETDPELIKNIKTRLDRMDEEFENLNRLIKLTAARADLTEFYPRHMDINDFLQQEMEFTKANLYFKHNVNTVLQLDGNLPALKDASEKLSLGLAWFIQGLAQELEKQQMESLVVTTSLSELNHQVHFSVGGLDFSDDAKDLFEADLPSSHELEIGSTNTGMLLSIILLKSCGASIKASCENSVTDITISIPSD